MGTPLKMSVIFCSIFLLAIAGFSNVVNAGIGNMRGRSSFLADACQSDSQCPADHCCVLGGYRYSVPQCRAMQQEGEDCRPSHELCNGLQCSTVSPETLNTTLSYPDGSQLEITGIHFVLCPCADNLTCNQSDKGATCRADFSTRSNANL